jgi:hypothetical protein
VVFFRSTDKKMLCPAREPAFAPRHTSEEPVRTETHCGPGVKDGVRHLNKEARAAPNKAGSPMEVARCKKQGFSEEAIVRALHRQICCRVSRKHRFQDGQGGHVSHVSMDSALRVVKRERAGRDRLCLCKLLLPCQDRGSWPGTVDVILPP